MNFSQFPLPTKILIGLSDLLIIGIPFANLYIPYFDTFGNVLDTYTANPTEDPHFAYRISIISFGFLATIIAILTFFSSFFKKLFLKEFTLNSALLLFICAIGFKNYPYWANGLLYQMRGIRPGFYDPKSILPQSLLSDDLQFMIFISVLIFYAICWITIPIILAFELYIIRATELKHKNILTLTALGLIVVSFFTTPEYATWIID